MQNSARPGIINRLTLFILVAMAAGIALGFALNKSYIADEISALEKIEFSQQQVQPSDSLQQASIKETLATRSKELRQSIDKKLEPFSILSDIFLRLIKMIIAPLVFTTLVVGVAKLGDISAVGRIGGKTLMWFIGASLLSLLLGMILVKTFLSPGP